MANQRRTLGLALAVFGASALGACRSIENGTTDFFGALEGVPYEAKVLKTRPLGDFVCCGDGLESYELGRRFENGVGGVSPDLNCALFFYSEAGVQSVVIRQTNVQMGGMVDTTYLGLPAARLALKRLAAGGHALRVADYAETGQRCRDVVQLSARPPPRPSAYTPS